MDGSLTHWLWTLGVLGLWLCTVISIYFMFLRKHIEGIKAVSKDTTDFFRTRHQRD